VVEKSGYLKWYPLTEVLLLLLSCCQYYITERRMTQIHDAIWPGDWCSSCPFLHSWKPDQSSRSHFWGSCIYSTPPAVHSYSTLFSSFLTLTKMWCVCVIMYFNICLLYHTESNGDDDTTTTYSTCLSARYQRGFNDISLVFPQRPCEVVSIPITQKKIKTKGSDSLCETMTMFFIFLLWLSSWPPGEGSGKLKALCGRQG
jgi:hypothetical protein